MAPRTKLITEAIAGVLLSVVAFFLVRTFGDIDELKTKTDKIPGLEIWATNQDQRLNRMETKLDEVLRIARESK